MRRLRFLIALAVAWCMIGGGDRIASALPNIQLGSDAAFYMDDDLNAWLTESWIVEESPFELDVLLANPSKSSSLVLTDLTLVVSVPTGEGSTANVSIEGTPLVFGAAGTPPELSPHGVFPTPYAYYPLGDHTLPPKGSLILSYDVAWSDASMVHFDAFATHSGHFQSSTEHIHFAPYSHDLTAVPEPATLTLLGSGLAGLGLWRRRRMKSERKVL